MRVLKNTGLRGLILVDFELLFNASGPSFSMFVMIVAGHSGCRTGPKWNKCPWSFTFGRAREGFRERDRQRAYPRGPVYPGTAIASPRAHPPPLFLVLWKKGYNSWKVTGELEVSMGADVSFREPNAAG